MEENNTIDIIPEFNISCDPQNDDSNNIVSSIFTIIGTNHQHFLFQVSNLVFLLSFLATNNRIGSIIFHSLLAVGYIIHSSWSWSVVCSINLFGWSILFITVNLIQVLYLIHSMKIIDLPSDELIYVYEELFEPMNISKSTFNKLISSDIASVNVLNQGDAYCLQNVTKSDRLGLLISGKVNVISGNNCLHSIDALEFLDSPEFDSFQPGIDSKFKVSIIAATECTYLSWNRPGLDEFLLKEKFLSSVLGLMIAKDVADKLFAMNSKIVTKQGAHVDIRLPAITTSLCNSLTSLQSGSDLNSGPLFSGRSSARSSICSLRIKDRSVINNSSLTPIMKSSRSKSLQVNSLTVPGMISQRGKRQSTGSIFSYHSSNGTSGSAHSSRRGSLSPNRVMM